ncbi:fimbria/pilus outer membrane usher protein [Achromobacter xylosoxidans]|uniref:fimbria/pilus outer membrane usher protein n=1 Tax=Alcaligenes xylosoxydans xylosoxydans TaxID=85698 RepID=UPI001F12C5B5|nr:fimbria/pilus outer membrane usher protein [Achromobacter xylosoxidans]
MTLARLAFLVAISTFVCTAQATEFSTGFLNTKDKNNIDLSTFSRDGYIAPGSYLLDIYLDQRLIQGQTLVKAVPVIGDGTVFCVTPGMVDMLSLKDEFRARLAQVNTAEGGPCIDLDTPDSRVVYSAEHQSLTLTVPQAWLQYQDPDWVPPARWSNGVNGVILDYNVLANRYMPRQGAGSASYTLYGTGGLNLGAWRLRSDYQYNRYDSGGQSQARFSLPQTYLFRALPQWRSKLTLGQTYLASAIFDPFRFAGVTLASDERMLPPSLQGYAPQITGIATSNAEVTVSQNGRLLYQTRVSPGPFVLPAVNQYVSGNLDVSLRESDGTKRSWQVSTASVPFMTRKGNLRYQVSLGRPLFGGPSGNHVAKPRFMAGEATWGAFNNTSLYGGLIVTDDNYQALALGAGQNMGALGALSADVTRSDARLPYSSAPRRTGYSYRVNYAKSFDDLGSTLAFMGYRFSGRHFLSMREFIVRSALHGGDFRDEKQSYTVSYSQYIQPLELSVSLSLSRLNYWNDAAANNHYMLSFNKNARFGPLRNVSLSLSLARTQSVYGPTQNQVYASLSIPLGDSRQLSYGYQNSGGGRMQQNVGYTDFSNPDTTWNLSASDDRDAPDRHQSVSGNIQSRTPYGRAAGDFTLQPGQYRSVGLNWYGSVTATAEGAAFGPPSSGDEPRMMIDTDGIAGVQIENGDGVTNRFGIAVVNGVSSYRESNLAVDVNALPDGVDVADAMISQVLTEGAIGYTRVGARHGEQVLGRVELADGSHPPLGALVLSTRSGKTAGMVADGGLVYLNVEPDDREALTVTWGGARECRLTLPAAAAIDQGPRSLPCH